MRRYMVKCESCGHEWQSRSASGRTECRGCGARKYVTLRERQEVVGVALSQQDMSDPVKVRAAQRRSLAHSRRADQPRQDRSAPAPPSRSPRRPEPHDSDGPNMVAEVANMATRVFTQIVKARAARPGTVPVQPHVAPVQEAPSPTTAPEVVERGRHGRPAYALEVGCGCKFGWESVAGPNEVLCSDHGWTPVQAMVAVDNVPGPLLIPPETRR